MSGPMISPSTVGASRTLQLPTRTSYGGSFQVWPSGCRLRSLNIQVDDDAASSAYLLVFDANAQPANGTIPLLRTSLLAAGQQAWMRELSTRDADLGGYPFDVGVWVALCTTPEFVAANVIESVNVTARLQVADCAP